MEPDTDARVHANEILLEVVIGCLPAHQRQAVALRFEQRAEVAKAAMLPSDLPEHYRFSVEQHLDRLLRNVQSVVD